MVQYLIKLSVFEDLNNEFSNRYQKTGMRLS